MLCARRWSGAGGESRVVAASAATPVEAAVLEETYRMRTSLEPLQDACTFGGERLVEIDLWVGDEPEELLDGDAASRRAGDPL